MTSPGGAAAAVARELLGRIEALRTPAFAERLEADPLVCWTRRGRFFLAGVFRFLDVFPSLETDREVLEHLRAHVGEAGGFLPGARTKVTAAAVRRLVAGLQQRFSAGGTLEEALESCRRLREEGLAFTLDLLGEAVLSDREAAAFHRECLGLIGRAAETVRAWPASPVVDESAYGPIPRLNVSVKLSSLSRRFDAIDFEGAVAEVAPRLREVFREARRSGAFVNVDMEQFSGKDLTREIFQRILVEEEFRDWPHVSLSLQTYLRGSREDFSRLLAWARKRGTPVTVRIVKGAYWDHEVQNARYRGWPVPVQESRERTDAEFEAAVRFVLENHRHLRPAVAGHNARSVAQAIATAAELGLPESLVEYQTLYGLGEELRRVLVERGLRVRVYAPFGGLLPGLAYLVRRLLEATSRSAFLREMWASPLPIEQLAAPPAPVPLEETTGGGRPRAIHPPLAKGGRGDFPPDAPFQNEPAADFSRGEARERMVAAIAAVRASLGGFHPLHIGGEEVTTGETLVARCPADPGLVVGRIAAAGPREAERAVRAALKAFPDWSRRPASERAACLRSAAAAVRRRRWEFAAWEIFETAKSWREADADVAEAIDGLEFAASEALRLAEPRRRDVAGETNALLYRPRGVTAAITPWNFPLAILAGTVSAALAAGNTVVMKPAEQSSVTASLFFSIGKEVGLPSGVLNFLPGLGETAGERLVRHPDVAVVAFTGSLPVGLRIQRLAASVRGRQRHLKRVVAEMGGKNAVIVDRDADLDQAVPGVAASAFGYQGQKCSACSRVVVHRRVYERFLERLVEAARSLRLGPPWDPGADLGPLISEDALGKVRSYADLGRSSCRVAYDSAETPPGGGFYAPPLVLADVDPRSAVAREEIFGPVLCVMPARDFAEAVRIANATRFGLCGGVYTRNPERLRRAALELAVGNLYLNRGITGALVDRQPFGGWKLSGGGAKTGGPDFLLEFLQPQTVSEWTVRRGFSPEISGA